MFLKIKNIPKVSWSSDKPLNLKPKFLTSFYLCVGLIIFGLGEGLLIVSSSGASPWSVLAQGLFLNIGFSVGLITIFISIAVLLLWFPLKQKPGIGTILNALIIGLMIDACIRYVPTPENYFNQVLLGAIAVFTVGLGGGIYLVANLGPGPRDGLMIGLQKKNKFTYCICKSSSRNNCNVYWLVSRWYSWCWNIIVCLWDWALYSFEFISY